jgi:hypothetical protein
MDAQTLGIIDESDSPVDSTTETPEASPAVEAQPEQTLPVADIVVPEPAAAVLAEVQSNGFRFLGKDWESAAKAEEVLGSQEGRITKANETIRGHEARINEYWDYVQAVSKENEELRVAAEERAQPKEDASAQAEGSRESWMKQVKLAMQIATQRGIDPNEVLMHAMEERLMQETEKRISERVEASTQPLREYEQAKQIDTAQQTLFRWAQGQSVSGSVRYPELQKDALYKDGRLSDNDNTKFVGTLHEIFNHFATQNPQFAYSGPGFDYAYRLAKEFHSAPPAAAPSTPQLRDDSGRFLSNGAARAASELSGTSPTLDRPDNDSTQRALKELGKHSTIKIGNTDLGFYE